MPQENEVRWDVDLVMDHAYDFDRKDLRRIAWEFLLISDGPDSPWRNPVNSPHNYEDMTDAAIDVVYSPHDGGSFSLTESAQAETDAILKDPHIVQAINEAEDEDIRPGRTTRTRPTAGRHRIQCR